MCFSRNIYLGLIHHHIAKQISDVSNLWFLIQEVKECSCCDKSPSYRVFFFHKIKHIVGNFFTYTELEFDIFETYGKFSLQYLIHGGQNVFLRYLHKETAVQLQAAPFIFFFTNLSLFTIPISLRSGVQMTEMISDPVLSSQLPSVAHRRANCTLGFSAFMVQPKLKKS